jgi:hypothetical protein
MKLSVKGFEFYHIASDMSMPLWQTTEASLILISRQLDNCPHAEAGWCGLVAVEGREMPPRLIRIDARP